MSYFVSKILIGESMVRIFKGNIGLGGEEPACEPPLSGKDCRKNINYLTEGKSEKPFINYTYFV